MVMPLHVPLPEYTVADLEGFPDDGCRYELVNGILLVTPAPAHVHQAILARVMEALWRYLGEAAPAKLTSPGVIQVAPGLHLEPDLLVYPARFGPETRWTEMTDWLLAIEVSGRGSRHYDRDYKRNAYLAAGVPEFWQVDLEARCVLVSRAGGPLDVRHAESLSWHPAPLPAPLVLDVRALFA